MEILVNPSRRRTPVFAKIVPIESLRALEVFERCDDRLLRKIGKLGTEVAAKERQVLAREGEPGREFYVIVDGCADVRQGSEVIASLGRGDFFGEMALVDGRPRSATVVATSSMTLYVFDPDEFFRLLDDFPPVSRKILSTLADRLRAAQVEQSEIREEGA